MEVGDGDDFGEAELEMEEDDNLMESMQAPENVDFSISEFKRLLFETNEGSMLQMMMASDKTQAPAKKIPQEALFIDWHDGLTRSYREQAAGQENPPAEGEEEQEKSLQTRENAANKGMLNLSDCNIIHQMIARGFAIDGSVEHILTHFTLMGAFNTERHMPPCAIILNRNLSLDKGINKILKVLSVKAAEDPETGGAFMSSHLPVGTLRAKNVISLFKFLVKQLNSEVPDKANYGELLEYLMGEKFWIRHLANSPVMRKIDFKNAVEDSRYQGNTATIIDHLNYLQGNPPLRTSTGKIEDPRGQGSEYDALLIDQIEGAGRTPEEYKSEEFVEALFKAARDPEGGLDGNVRLGTFGEEEFCPGKTEQKILKQDVGPILLAIKAGNPAALKDMLEKDKLVNLRESLSGPREIFEAQGQPLKRWRYTFNSPAEMTLEFENIGFALVADCDHNTTPNHHQTMLVQLLKQPSFIPEPHDFESFVTICLLKKTTLMLKTFLQSFQMQFIFQSFQYERQRRIIRLLLGLSPGGEESVSSVFGEANLIMKKPFLIFTLLEFLENGKRIQGAENIAKELLTTLKSQDLVMIAYIDRDLVESVVTTEDWLERLLAEDQETGEVAASEMLVNITTQIVNRIKSENADMLESMAIQGATASVAGRGEQAPEDLAEGDQGSELEEMYEVDIKNKEEGGASKPANLSLDISADDD